MTQSLLDLSLVDILGANLDRGEAEAIALALYLKADYILIDELAGRLIAQEKGLIPLGVLGVLIRAKEKGYISAVKFYMDRLITIAGFRIHPALYASVLNLVEA